MKDIKSLLVGPSKEEMKDYWMKLGYDQSFDTPEEFFMYVISGIKIKQQNIYPNSIFWEKKGEILFEQDLKTNYLWVKYDSIWSVLQNVLGFNYYETQTFIKDKVGEYINCMEFTPIQTKERKNRQVREYLNYMEFTPVSCEVEFECRWKNI